MHFTADSNAGQLFLLHLFGSVSSFSSSFSSSSFSSSSSSSFRCRCRCCCGDVVMWLNLFGDLTAYPIKGKTWARGTTAYATSSCEPSGKPTDRI